MPPVKSTRGNVTQPSCRPDFPPLPFSIVIPAYNEAGAIGRCLDRILRTMPEGADVEIIVVPNGCHDETAEIARRFEPRVRVIELAEGSKAAALNAGNAAATATPRLFVDADIDIDFAVLAALADALREPGVMAASPAALLDTDACSPLVRAYYRVWSRHRYLEHGVGGSGVYGLSDQGLARLGDFPPIIADDGYVRALFSPSEQYRVSEGSAGQPIYATVRPPRTVRELIVSEARWRAGDAQVGALLGAAAHLETKAGNASGLAKSGAAVPDLAAYYAIKLMGRLTLLSNRVRRVHHLWHRDVSSRGG